MPIYNSPAKRYYNRAAKGGYDKILPVKTPPYKLPAFQFNAEDDDFGMFKMLKLVPEDGNNNLITSWTNNSYASFLFSGGDITSAINTNYATARSNNFTLRRGEFAVLKINLTLNSGTVPSVNVVTSSGSVYLPSGTTVLRPGLITLFIMGIGEINTGYLTMTSSVASDYSATFNFIGGNYTYIAFDSFGGFGQNAYTVFNNASHPYDFDVWNVTGDYYEIEKTGTMDSAYAESNYTYNVVEGGLYGFNISITVNSGDLPYIRLVNSAGSTISNTIQLQNGENYCIFRATGSDTAAKIKIFMMAPETINMTLWKTHFGLYTFINEPHLIGLEAGNYWQYTGDALNALPVGVYCAELLFTSGTTVYSDWIEIDNCIYDELVEEWTNGGYDSFVSGLSISASESSGGAAAYYSNTFQLYQGEKVRISFNLNHISGVDVNLRLCVGLTYIDSETCVNGLNEFEFVATVSGDYYIRFDTDNNVSYDIYYFRCNKDYSEKYIRLRASNSCDIGDFDFHDGLIHEIYLEGETMEPSFPLTEEGQENGEGRFVRTFARQVKRYNFKTKLLPGYIIELLHRMRMFDTVELTDTLGDTNTVYNIEVEHEWMFDDKYYGMADLTFDYNEAYVMSSCCVDLAEAEE